MSAAPPNFVILKRPSYVQKADDYEKTKPQIASKTFEEKQAEYDAARKRILGSDKEEVSDNGQLSDSQKDPAVNELPESKPASPSKKQSQTKEKSLETSMESLQIDGKRKKAVLFTAEEIISNKGTKPQTNGNEGPQNQNYQCRHRNLAPVSYNKTLNQMHYNTNNGLVHPYANSNVNHVRPYHFPPQVVSNEHYQHHMRFPPNYNIQSYYQQQTNLLSPPPPQPLIPVNVPPPGFYSTQPQLLAQPLQTNGSSSQRKKKSFRSSSNGLFDQNVS